MIVGFVIDEEDDKPKHTKRPRRWLRRLVILVVLIAGLGFWLNGPGLRMLGPRLGSHFAAKAGVEVTFEIRGTLVGGVSLHDVVLSIPGTGLKKITILEIVPDYQFTELIKGEVRGVSGRGLHLDIELMPSGDKPSESLDFAVLNGSLRQAQAAASWYAFDVIDLTTTIHREGMATIEMGPTSIRHEAGSEEILIELGAITRGGEPVIEAQRIQVEWKPERLGFDRVVVHPELGLTNIALSHPGESGLFVEGVVDFADAVFHLTSSPEQASLGLHLREGTLDAEKVGEVLDIEMPAAGRLTSLSLDVENFAPDSKAATANLNLLLENLSWEEVQVDELNLEVILDVESARVVARAAAGDAELRMDATSTLDREAMALVETRGVLESPVLSAVVDRFVTRPEDAAPMPGASAKVDFHVGWSERFVPTTAKADMVVTTEDPEVAPGFQLIAEWTDEKPLVAKLLADGLQADAKLDFATKRYSGSVAFGRFESARYETWLAAAGVDLPGDAKIEGAWRGNGSLAANGHQGELVIASALWVQPDQPDVSAGTNVSYAFPGRISLQDLQVVRDGQTIDANLALADGSLEIDRLQWTDADGTEMADARGNLPMPEDFGKWREFLASDTRPLDLTIRTQTLGFDKLATWVPALVAVDARTTAELEVSLSGNFSAPVLDASLEVRGLRAVDQPALPSSNIVIKASGRDGLLAVDGTITAPDYDPVVLTAKLPFAPAAWAEDVKTLTGADFEASAILPRLDLSRFIALVPAARSITGVVTGNVRAVGTLGKPDLSGGLELAGGSLRFVNDMLPDITGITGVAEFGIDQATLRSLRATIAGGTLEASGSFAIKSREIDLRARGSSLPLVRNEGLIVRANADLRATGAFDRATLSGSVSLVDSLLFRDIEILPIGMPFTGPAAASLPKIDTESPTAAIPAPFANWPLDVRLTTAEPLLIRGNLATGRILGDLRVGGTLADPRPNGTVRLLRGRAVLPFSTLAVPEAVLTFTPANGLDPIIEARGTAEPRPYTVNLFAYGRLSDPQIVLSSTPPLPQNEIMTLLATGTTTRGLEDPQMASARALQLFAEEVRRGRVPLGNQLRPLLGLLDKVDFTLAESDPYSSDKFSTATLKLHDRWYLFAGMGDEGNTRMFAIWRLRFR